MYKSIRLIIKRSVFCIFLSSACSDPSEISPSTLLPFEYSARLGLTSSTCLNSRRSVRLEQTANISIGNSGALTVMDIRNTEVQWRFEGLICTDQRSKPHSLCLSLRDSELLYRIPRAHSDGEPLSCIQEVYGPASAADTGLDTLSARDAIWSEFLDLCCQERAQNAQALYFELEADMSIIGQLTLQYEVMIESKANSQEPSNDERLGALALCGAISQGEELIDRCIDRFELRAQRK